MKYAATTPLFDNITDKFGKDEPRIIYQDPKKCIIVRGKLNGSVVLCLINGSDRFYDLYDLKTENVKMGLYDDLPKTLKISYKEPGPDYKEAGLKRKLLFDLNEFEPRTNELDEIYDDGYFLKSYLVNGKIRAFYGLLDFEGKTVKPYAYDVSKKEIIELPTKKERVFNLYTLIDDEKMMEYLQKEDSDQLNNSNIGLDFYTYLYADISFAGSVLAHVGFNRNEIFEEMKKLEAINNGEAIKTR